MIVAGCRRVKSAVPWSTSTGSIASEAARRLDGGEFVEIEIDNGLQSLSGGAMAGGFGHSGEPIGVFGLQGEQFDHRGLPSLNPRAPVGRSAIADEGSRSMAGAIAGLTLGSGESALAKRPASGLAVWGACGLLVIRHVTD
jgi:hypothetical protein